MSNLHTDEGLERREEAAPSVSSSPSRVCQPELGTAAIVPITGHPQCPKVPELGGSKQGCSLAFEKPSTCETVLEGKTGKKGLW